MELCLERRPGTMHIALPFEVQAVATDTALIFTSLLALQAGNALSPWQLAASSCIACMVYYRISVYDSMLYLPRLYHGAVQCLKVRHSILSRLVFPPSWKAVDESMGPTHVWPGTNTVEHHATLWGAPGGFASVLQGCFRLIMRTLKKVTILSFL